LSFDKSILQFPNIPRTEVLESLQFRFAFSMDVFFGLFYFRMALAVGLECVVLAGVALPGGGGCKWRRIILKSYGLGKAGAG
jgi:hypothetical protein